MPSPRKGEQEKDFMSRCMSSEESQRSFPEAKQRVAFCNSEWENKSSATTFIYRDPKTGELYHYSRRGLYKKDGRTLVFVRKSKGKEMSEHILNKIEEAYSDQKAGYPPNCNEGYVEKDGKCVPVEDEKKEK